MMEQIKNYLSQLPKLNKVILLSFTPEFKELGIWLLNNKKVSKIYNEYEYLHQKKEIDAIIFDYYQSEFLINEDEIYCDLLIGRVKEKENFFQLWEKYREKVNEVYIEKNGNIRKEISSECSKCEILHWKKNKTKVELSVVIPVYNVAEYLPRCIESLIKWQAPYVEYIFVDDGSTDHSSKIITDYAQKDSRICLITKENGGCASARNRGIKAAKGKYIGFVDSDDFIDETMFKKLFARAMIGGYDIAYCGYKEYEEETGRTIPVLNDYLGVPYVDGTWSRDKVQLLTVKTRVAIWRCIYKKELFFKEKIFFHEELKRFDDLPFRLEAYFTARSAVCVPEYLYYYRVGRIGQDVSCRDIRLYVHFTIFDILDQFVDSFQDKRLKDLLQIVKLHTHGFALSKIEKIYKQEYLHKAIKQLDRNMGYRRTICLLFLYTGKKNILWYTWAKIKRGN